MRWIKIAYEFTGDYTCRFFSLFLQSGKPQEILWTSVATTILFLGNPANRTDCFDEN